MGKQSIGELAKKKGVLENVFANIVNCGLNVMMSKYNVDLIIYAIVMLCAV